MSIWNPKKPELCLYCGHMYHGLYAICGLPVMSAKGKPCLCRGHAKTDEAEADWKFDDRD